MVRTAQAGVGELGGGRGVQVGVGGEVAAAERPGHWTAAMGMGKAWGGAALNKSEGPGKDTK